MSPPSARKAVALGGAIHIVYALPLFLSGAVAVQITTDLGFGDVGLGSSLAFFYVGSSLASPMLGRVADRIGALRALRFSALAAAAASFGIAVAAHAWLALALFLGLSGVAGALGQPAANRLLSRRVPPNRLGVAFGIKQAAAPMSSLLAGLSVPSLVLLLGWRSAFVASAALGLLVALGAGRSPRSISSIAAEQVRGPLRDRPTLVLLAFGMGLSMAANSAVLGFYVVAAVDAGTLEAHAGVVYSVASLAAVASRVLAARYVDRRPVEPLRLSTGMLLVGAAGCVGLMVPVPAVMAASVTLALVGVWGFNSVFWFAAMKNYPEAPGRATGALAPSTIGGSFGALVFGSVAHVGGYPAAWLTAAALALAAAGAMLLASRRIPERTEAVTADAAHD